MVIIMNERKNFAILLGFVLSVSLLTSTITAMLLINYYSRFHFDSLGQVCKGIMEIQPEAEKAIMSALKQYVYTPSRNTKVNIISSYGYSQSDFLQSGVKYSMVFVCIGFLSGMTLFIITFMGRRRKEIERIKALTDYLENVNTGNSGLLIQSGEDDFSKLQDEIYKTVTMLYQTREAALKAKDNFAQNISNIAHQIKTPITSISLTIQMMKEKLSPEQLEKINRQLYRLTHLEEALLLLSRIDSGTLYLKRTKVDVFTLLMLAADNLQEVFSKKNVYVNIPESDETIIYADLDWTMEAIMNLLKNCMENTPEGGSVNCQYEQNPVYTLIRIWDTGNGFAKEDIAHLFERFYRGQNAKSNGIGIGLSLSKAIIESQNGTISAKNLTDGGACFEICFYSH